MYVRRIMPSLFTHSFTIGRWGGGDCNSVFPPDIKDQRSDLQRGIKVPSNNFGPELEYVRMGVNKTLSQ